MKTKKLYVVNILEDNTDFHVIFEKENVAAARSLVTVKDKQAILWSIHVDKAFRKKGYATSLIRAMQKKYDSIETAWYNTPLQNLLMKLGFEYQGDDVDGVSLVWFGVIEGKV